LIILKFNFLAARLQENEVKILKLNWFILLVSLIPGCWRRFWQGSKYRNSNWYPCKVLQDVSSKKTS